VLVDVGVEELMSVQGRIKRLIHPCATPMDYNIAVAWWFAARGRGRLCGDGEAALALKDSQGLLRYRSVWWPAWSPYMPYTLVPHGEW
jgi:hypothetical protein